MPQICLRLILEFTYYCNIAPKKYSVRTFVVLCTGPRALQVPPLLEDVSHEGLPSNTPESGAHDGSTLLQSQSRTHLHCS